jgi:hypothetical protein
MNQFQTASRIGPISSETDDSYERVIEIEFKFRYDQTSKSNIQLILKKCNIFYSNIKISFGTNVKFKTLFIQATKSDNSFLSSTV